MNSISLLAAALIATALVISLLLVRTELRRTRKWIRKFISQINQTTNDLTTLSSNIEKLTASLTISVDNLSRSVNTFSSHIFSPSGDFTPYDEQQASLTHQIQHLVSHGFPEQTATEIAQSLEAHKS